ncbi:MAG: HAD family phosphatase [Ruminococcaceae bacterium]|nr:HAD family phosphatase [Oscillospiraceae bacterium]
MSIRLIAFDLDYTILQTGGTVSPKTASVLQEAKRRGIMLVPATGRGIFEMEDLLSMLTPDYAVTVNGSVVWGLKQQSVIFKQVPPQKALLEKIKLAEDMGLYTEVYCNGVYTNQYSYDNMEALGMLPDQLDMFKATRQVVPNLYEAIGQMGAGEKLHIIFKDVQDKEARQGAFLNHPAFAYTSAFVNNLELSDKTVHKASGLLALCEKLGVSQSEVMALGDGTNDVTMLSWAGLGVAMANAVPEAKKAADVITLSNDDDGAAIAIEKYCF